MRLFKIQLKLKNSLGTPLMSDTIFGHICWSIRYNKSQEKLTKFLKQMKSDNPPLILSDVFRKDCLPVPVLPEVIASNPTVQESDNLKKAKKQNYIQSDRLYDLADSISSERILQELTQFAVQDNKENYLVPHNTVSRLGAGTIENGLFFNEDAYFDRGGADYELLAGSDFYDSKEIQEIMELAFRDGYGRDKSTGKGVVEVSGIQEYQLPEVENPNSVMLLGRSAPSENDPTEGYWNLLVKEGKLGGHWAVNQDYRKKPVVMLTAGSLLFTNTPKAFYGRMVENVHNELPQVLHYGYTLAMPLHIQESEMMYAV